MRPMMQLVIGNKNYSSWSMRPWVLLREFGLPFDEVALRFDSFEPQSRFKQAVARYAPSGTVPILVLEGGQAVWDTLAIVETLAELHPREALWPRDAAARARARSLCAEMHAGYGALRRLCPQTIEASLPQVGARLLAEHADRAALQADLARLAQRWEAALAAHGGPFLFGAYSIADAYFAPVAMRLLTYGLPTTPTVGAYVQRLRASRGVAAWVEAARAEHDFLPHEEPYRTAAQR